jgi:predicted O-methyltransferase YrrM
MNLLDRSCAALLPPSQGALLELGTGTGMGTSWLLSGMDGSSTLDTVDNDGAVVDIARRYLGHDSRVRFHVADGATFLAGLRERRFDLIFADTWPGKFEPSDCSRPETI